MIMTSIGEWKERNDRNSLDKELNKDEVCKLLQF